MWRMAVCTSRRFFNMSSKLNEPAGGGTATAVPPRGCSHFKLKQASRLVGRHYDAHLGQLAGLKTTQYSLLSHLAAQPRVRPADLAAAMALTPSTLTRNLRALVEQGWVASVPGDDARSHWLSLTPEGKAKRAQAQKVWKGAQLAFNAKLGEARVARLHAVLDDCLAALAESGIDQGNLHD